MNMERKNKRTKKQRTRNAPYKSQNGVVHRTQHLRAAPLPKQMCLRLRWSDDQTITSISSWRFGLAQFWNQLPGYYVEFMKIYKMSRILSVKLRCTVINTTANTPAEVVAVTIPFSDYSKTLAQVKQLPSAVYRFLSGSGGIDKVSLTKDDNLNSSLGVDSRAIRDYQQSASEAASTLALLPDTPVLALYVGGAATEPTLRVFITVDYDIEFFELEYPGSVALQAAGKSKDMTSNLPAQPPKKRPLPLRKRRCHLESLDGSSSDDMQ